MRSYTRTAAQAHSKAAVTVAMMISRSLCLTLRFRYVLSRISPFSGLPHRDAPFFHHHLPRRLRQRGGKWIRSQNANGNRLCRALGRLPAAIRRIWRS
jgi:hypothetical protein